MDLDDPYEIIEESPQFRLAPAPVRVDKMFEAIKKTLPGPPLFLLCILPERKNSDIYGPWKRRCLVDFGIVTQCMAPSARINDQYLTNLLLKINAKMGGINSMLSIEYMHSIPLVSRTPTIISGMDVSHGAVGRSDVPSIAAVVSSRNWPFISRYRASVRTQSSRVEMIDGLFKSVPPTKDVPNKDEGMIRELLDDFYLSTPMLKPQNIIIFRDGVSESQFNQVLNIKLEQIMQILIHPISKEQYLMADEINDVVSQNVNKQSDVQDRRPSLRVQGNVFVPSHCATSAITKIWKAHFTGEWDTWKSIPKSNRDILFRAFKKNNKWDASIESDVERVFNILGAKSFGGFMCRARKRPTEKPKFINLTTWQALWRKWRSEEFAIKSNRGRVARQANKCLHTGGSISMVDHSIRLRKELGRDPTAPEHFGRTHKRKDDTFVDSEAERTWVGYNEKYGSDDSVDASMGDVSKSYSRWIEHVGIKNGRVYGEGSGVDEFSLRGNNMDEPSVSSSNNHGSSHLESMFELQQTQLVLLREEQDQLRSTQEEHTTKLDQVVNFQSSFEENIRNTMSEEVRQLVSHEIGKVALEVRKVVAQEVGKSVAQEIGKAQRQILEAIQRRQ